MKFQFKKKLSAFTDNNILLATTKFGNIIYVDNVLKVESALHTIYEYDFIKNEWTKHHGKLDIVANVTIDAIECDLVVINPLFFDYIELYDSYNYGYL